MKKRNLFTFLLCIILAFCTGLFAACGGCNGCGGEITALTVPEVTVDGGGTARWSTVENASGYAFKIDGGEEKSTSFTSVILSDGQSVSVKAVGDGKLYVDSEWSVPVKYTAAVKPPVDPDNPTGPDRPTGPDNPDQPTVPDNPTDPDEPDKPAEPVVLGAPALTVLRDGSASWAAVAGASGYAYKLNGGEEVTASERKLTLSDGDTVAVRAIGDGEKYLDGPAASITYTAPKNAFDAPVNLTAKIEGTNKGTVVLKWDAVLGARGYAYAINGDEARAVKVYEDTVTVDLSAQPAAAWSFKVMTLDDGDRVAADGNYGNRYNASGYCDEVEFRVPRGDEKVYSVTEIMTVMNYFGGSFPTDEFCVKGTVEYNTATDIILTEQYKSFTLAGADVSADFGVLYEDALADCTVTAKGRLTAEGLADCTVSLQLETEAERYALATAFLNGMQELAEGAEHTKGFAVPVKLYGVSVTWFSDNEGLLSVGDDGAATVTRPAISEEDGVVILSAILTVGEDIYDDELECLLSVPAKTYVYLDAPKISINPNTGVATWTAVENAFSYNYELKNEYGVPYAWEKCETPLSITLEKYYTLRVQAVGNGEEYIDSDWAEKKYNYHPETTDPEGTPLVFNFSGAIRNANEVVNPKPIFDKACASSSSFLSVSTSNLYLGCTVNTAALFGDGFIRVGTAGQNGTIKLTFSSRVNGVKIKCRTWNKDGGDKVSVNGSAEQNAAKNDWGVLTFNFGHAADAVEIVTNKRVFILEITVYLEN